MAEDIAKLQRQRAQAEAAGDQEAVANFDARIEAATPSMGVMDYASDWGQSLFGGPRRGLESIVGTGGDAYDLMNSVSSYAGGATEPVQRQLYDAMDKERLLPDSADVERATEEAYPFLGKHYEPKTGVGRFLNNLGATVTGGGGRHFFREHLMPAAGGTIGADIGEAVGGDIGAQVGSLAGGGVASSGHEAAMRGLVREVDPVVQRQIEALRHPGPDPQNPLTPVELTGGQALDSPTLKYIEAGPFGGKAAGIGEDQARQFTRRALELAGIRGSDTADFHTMGQAQAQLGQRYENLVQANNGIVMSDPMLQQQLIDAGVNFERIKGAGPSVVQHYYDRIADASQQHGGVLPPDVFQAIHSEMSADLRRMRNSPELAQQSEALRDMEGALFDSIGRNGRPDIQAEAQALNRQYRNFKILEDAMYSTGTDASRGIITPGALASAVKKSESKAGFTQGRSDFSEMANAGSGVMKEIGNTGSGGRAAIAAAGGGVAGGLGMVMSGQPLAGAAAIGSSIAAPFIPAGISAAVASRPVRASLVNRATGNAPSMFTPLAIQAATPAMWQAGAQHNDDEPVPVERAAPAPEQQGFVMPEDMGLAPVEQPGGPLPEPVMRMLRARGLA